MKDLRKKLRNVRSIGKEERGITMVALVVTVIVLLILGSISIAMLTGENSIITKSSEAKVLTELSTFKEELELFKIEKLLENSNFEEISLTGGKNSLTYNTQEQGKSETIYDVITSLKGNKYADKLEIIKGELVLNTQDITEIKLAQNIGIQVNPYDIEDGTLLSSSGNLLLMDETGTLTIPDSVTEIGEGAFSNLNGLKTIIIPGTCKVIGKNAFANNATLETVIIQDGVEKIGLAAFQNCTNLKTVQMANSVIEIESKAFFYDASLTNINLSSGLKKINSYTFYNCKGIKEITFPEKIEEISAYAFYGCTGLESITISKKLSTIDARTFSGATSLQSIIVDPENTNFEFKDGILLGNNKQEMIIILNSAISGDTFVVPEGVTKLSSSQLSSFSQINTVEIPSTVTTIDIGFFSKNITNVIIDNDNSIYESDGKAVYTKDGQTLIRYYANESNVIIKSGIYYISDQAFQYQNNITEVVLPDTLQRVGSQAFDCCSQLTSINLGENVNNFNNMSIYGSGIESITIDENNPNYTVINGALYNKDGTIFISPIKKIGSITTYEIPSGVKEIASYAFHYQNKMTSIILPNSLEKIGRSFNYCTSLTKIEIPSSVTEINSTCFDACGNNLTQIIVHKSKGSISGSPWGCIYGDKAVIWDE